MPAALPLVKRTQSMAVGQFRIKEKKMKLLRFGPVGAEKPGILDADDNICDLSGMIDDVSWL